MTSGESPTFARRRVRLALREAREAAHRTQSDVAEAMEWSLSKVIRIEGGEVSISPNDLRPLLSYLGIRDRARVDSLLADAKASRVRQTKQWWNEPRFRDHLTPALRRLVEFEAEAVYIRYFYIYSFPGPLQVPAYARAVMEKWHDDLTPAEFRMRLEARLLRRDQLLNKADPPHIAVLLDESLLLRTIAGADLLSAQLSDMLRLSQEGRLAMRVVPFDAEDAPLMSNPTYDLLYLSRDKDYENAFVYRETGTTDEILEDSKRIEVLQGRYDKLWNAAINEEDTIKLVQERLRILGENAARER